MGRRNELPSGGQSVFVAVAGALAPVAGALDVSQDFDRNALQAAVRTGDAIVAVMASGNLLRFDARTLALAAEAVPHTRAAAIAFVRLPRDPAREP
jgi:hypothetical protein